MIAVLPATSVDCERGFSNLARIKNNLRNGLQSHLEPLMPIFTTAMDPLVLRKEHHEDLIEKWKGRNKRRSGGKEIVYSIRKVPSNHAGLLSRSRVLSRSVND